MTEKVDTGIHLWGYFNSHPHEEDDGTQQQVEKNVQHFNSHPHEEDDRKRKESYKHYIIFQLTSSRRG